jgi:hypothetical protein
VTERSRQGGARQQVEIALASLKRVFGIGETLAKTLVGLASRIVVKICAHTYAFSWLIVGWRDHKGGSKSYGPEPRNTHLVLCQR